MGIPKWLWRQNSLRHRLITSVIIMTLPLIAMLLYNNFYAIHTVRVQVSDSYKNLLNLYMTQIDAGLNDADAYMSTVANGVDLLSLKQAETDSDYYTAKIYLHNKLSEDISLYGSVSSFFVYAEHRQDFMDISNTMYVSIEENERVGSYIADLIHSRRIPKGNSTKRWQHHRIGQDDYLINIVHTANVYLGGWVKTDHLLRPLRTLQLGEGGAVILANDQGEPITKTSVIKDYGIELHKNMNQYYLSGSTTKYLVIGAPSKRGNFTLAALIPDKHILANLPYLQGIVWFITIASLFFVPIGLYFMRRDILVPLYRILSAMRKVRAGDWSNRVVLPNATEEFKRLGESFNSMMTEIETLRVNVYEEQLNKQREELQRLQLQINPHFFLNSLNIVYNLAKVKSFDVIMEMTMALIHYFRFMFRSNTSFVKLKDEIEFTRNYLRIQTLRFPGQLSWSVDAPDYLTYIPIPPLVIQSFVENSIKHAFTMEEPVHVSVCIRIADEDRGTSLGIRIEDTGKGFSEKILKELQAGRSVENDRGEHTGIWNVERRLRLLYGDSATVQFFNDEKTGGAVVEILVPTNPI